MLGGVNVRVFACVKMWLGMQVLGATPTLARW